MFPWTALTSLGDVKAMAPVAATIALGLVLGRAGRMALWWCLLLAASFGLGNRLEDRLYRVVRGKLGTRLHRL